MTTGTVDGPDPPEDVIVGLRRRYDELTNSQKRIAETIVEDPQFVAFATVDKFAARLGVSPSTIVRFSYRLGLAGYPDLQNEVRKLVLRGLPSAGEEGIDAAEHLGAYGESIRHDTELLSRAAQRLDAADLDRAVTMLVTAERVRVAGGVTAFGVAYYAAVTLDRVRKGVAVLGGGQVPTGPLLDLEAGDAVLAFTFPPYARSTLGALEAAKKRGANVIAVTDSPLSPARTHADVLLAVPVSGIGTQNSLVAAMSITNAIVNAVTERSPGALERYSDAIRLLSDWDIYLLETGSDD